MKKSTLITTIAMIVVVVVALSTATYAWFSSASTNQVTATVSTAGNGDFALSQATVADPNASGVATLSNWSAASNAINLSTDTLMSGLHAPTASITEAACGLTSESATTGMAKFYEAESADNNATAKITTAAGFLKPTVIRIQNISGSPKQLKVYIDINIGDGSNSATNSAGKSVAFVLICETSAFASKAVLTSGYGYGGTQTPAAQDETYTLNEIISTPTTAPTDANYIRPAYNGTTTGFDKLLADDPLTGGTVAQNGRGGLTNEYVNSQSLTIDDNLPNSGIVYITLYLWLDGWRADNSAAGANDLKIGIRFYGEAVD